MKAPRCILSGLLIAAAFLSFVFQAVEAKTIYIAVSNPDMSFLSGGVAKFQGYFKDEGLDVEVSADERQRFGSGIGGRQRGL